MSEPLLRSIRVKCGVEHAFHTFTARIDLWWPPGHRKFESSTLHLEPRVGGSFYELSAEGERQLFGEVLSWSPPSAFSYSWWPGALERPTRVEIGFEGDGEFTRVNVRHEEADSGLADAWPQRVKIFTGAWSRVLAALGGFIDGEST